MTREARTGLKVVITLAPLALSCAYASPVQPAATSKSPFWFLGWGEPVQVVSEIPEGEQFRISHRASSGFTPVSAVRRSAEARAREFCERTNLQMTEVTEQVSSAPHILGNFPRAEIVFVCTEKPPENRLSPVAEDPYERLRRLKELLDAGVISQSEFDREKSELLAK